jgi:Gpi18-like mannosyltransferase
MKIIGAPMISVFSIDSNIPNHEYPISWMSYLTVLILITVLTLVLLATVKGHKREPENKWLNSFNFQQNMKHFAIRKG